jgi:hypothetical protein
MQEHRQERRQQAIDRQQQQVAGAAETADMTRQELDAWLAEELKRIDQTLASSQKEYDTLAAADAQLADVMFQLRRDLNGSKFAEQTGVVPTGRGVPLSLRLEEKLADCQKQRIKLSLEAETVNQRLTNLKAEREATTDRHQSATGQLAEDKANAQRSKKALERAGEKNKSASTRAKRATQARKQQLKQLSTYLRFDVQGAKRNLRAELGQDPTPQHSE